MKSDEQILLELEQAAEGLLFMSESDYPFAVVRLEGPDEISSASLRQQAGEPEDAAVEIRSLEDFFRNAVSEEDWRGAQARADAKKYQLLVRMLKENLDDVKVYRIGETNIPVYIIGKSASGNWLGLSTRVVET